MTTNFYNIDKEISAYMTGYMKNYVKKFASLYFMESHSVKKKKSNMKPTSNEDDQLKACAYLYFF